MEESELEVAAEDVHAQHGEGHLSFSYRPAGVRSVAVFWRRFFGFAVDFLILGAAGLALGLFFGALFARMGNWGKLVGLAMALLYFVPLDSAMGDGQTFGKKLLKVKVVDGKGETIPVGLSALRFLIVAGPIFLNGLNFSYDGPNMLYLYLVAVIIFGIGGGIVYLSIFNVNTRQSLHDLICGTYVVRADSEGRPTGKSVATLHYIVYTAYFACLIAFLVIGVPRLVSMDLFQDLTRVQSELERVSGVRSSSVIAGKYVIGGGGKRYLKATVYLESKPESFHDVIDKSARAVFRSYPEIGKTDSLVIVADYGYDIGVYSSHQSFFNSKPPGDWARDLGMKAGT